LKALASFSPMTNTNTHSRAKAGGEFGANGEWYEGGKFINTVADNAKGSKEAKKATRKQEVENYKWEVAPVAGQLALYPMMAGMEISNRNRENPQFTFNPCLRGQLATPEYIEIRKARIAAFNAGGRWI